MKLSFPKFVTIPPTVPQAIIDGKLSLNEGGLLLAYMYASVCHPTGDQAIEMLEPFVDRGEYTSTEAIAAELEASLQIALQQGQNNFAKLVTESSDRKKAKTEAKAKAKDETIYVHGGNAGEHIARLTEQYGNEWNAAIQKATVDCLQWFKTKSAVPTQEKFDNWIQREVFKQQLAAKPISTVPVNPLTRPSAAEKCKQCNNIRTIVLYPRPGISQIMPCVTCRRDDYIARRRDLTAQGIFDELCEVSRLDSEADN